MDRVYTLNVLTKNRRSKPVAKFAALHFARFGSFVKPRWFALLAILALAGSSGCATIGYYAQAVNGHLDMMSKREPLEKVMNAEDTDPEIRRKLVMLRDARVFAASELKLPDNESYSTFVETGKKYITWNVVAAPEFSMSPKTWCFPVAGCVSYRGYFAEEEANAYEAELKAQGFDTQIGGATAYSTLGWFDDPLLDTMLRGSDVRLTGVLFHELAHQLLYVKDDSSFNEAFATFVEQQGAKQWLASIGKGDKVPVYEDFLQRQIDFTELLQDTRKELVSLFASDEFAKITQLEDKRLEKQAVFDRMLENYEQLKTERWDGYTGYDNWFSKEMNNARLISVSTYLKWVRAFRAMYDESGKSLEAFYKAATEVSKLDRPERLKRMQAYFDASSAEAKPATN